jgi:hypothetical protein
MRFSLQTWIIIALLICIAIIISFWPKPVDNSEPFKREIVTLNSHIETLNQDRAKLRAEIDTIKAQEAKYKQVYETKVKDQSALIAKLKGNPKVITVLKENPEVDSLVHALDSAVMMRDVRIASLEFTQLKMELTITGLTANFEESLKLEREKFALAEQRIADLEKQNRKERRKKKLSQVLIPIVAAGAFLLGVQL